MLLLYLCGLEFWLADVRGYDIHLLRSLVDFCFMFLLLSTPRDSFRLYILDKIIIITIRVRVIRVFHLKDMKNWRFTSSGKNRTTGVYTGLPVVLLSLRKFTGVSPDYRCSRSDYRLGLVS